MLQALEPQHAEAVISDPPYGIAFMGRAWDHFGTGPTGMRRFQSWTTEWAAEARRHTRPGANWLIFASPRTFHRTACGLEDAGIEIVDCVLWVYGEGFPKTPMLDDGASTRLKPSYEPILLGRTPSEDGARTTYERHGTGMLQIGDCLIEGSDGNGHWSADDATDGGSRPGYEGGFRRGGSRRRGRWPANLILDAAAAEVLDQQAGPLRSGGEPRRRRAPVHSPRVYEGRFTGATECPEPAGENRGAASRFFYCQKATAEDRESAADGTPAGPNDHPCVKPRDLMRWLVRLVTRQGQHVIDPFAGSGSTGVACVAEERSFLGIEKEREYVHTARRRLRGRGAGAPVR